MAWITRASKKRSSLLPFTVLTLGSILSFDSPAMALDCPTALHTVADDMTDRLGALISSIQELDIDHPGNPYPGTTHLIIVLDGETSYSPKAAQAATNILSSPKLNDNYAKQIMGACPQFSIVSFGLANTGWQNMYYRFADGAVRSKLCISEPTKHLLWGVGYCD